MWQALCTVRLRLAYKTFAPTYLWIFIQKKIMEIYAGAIEGRSETASALY